MNRNPDPHIYFISPIGEDGPIKVGHSIHTPLRLTEFNKWSPIALEIVALVPIPAMDGRSRERSCNTLERRFHLRYADYRMHHEWFAAHPLILADIQEINAGTFDTERLPEWQKVDNTFIRRTYSASEGGGMISAPPLHGAARDRSSCVSRAPFSPMET